MTETQLVNACLEFLSYQKGVKAWRNNTGAYKTESGGFVRYGEKGSPDIIVCHRGDLIGIEAKVGKNIQSEAQKQWQYELEEAGGLYLIVRSLEELEKRFKGLAK